MPRDVSIKRDAIMDIAQQMALDAGLSGTYMEKVIELELLYSPDIISSTTVDK